MAFITVIIDESSYQIYLPCRINVHISCNSSKISDLTYLLLKGYLKQYIFLIFFFVLLGCHSHHTALVTWEYVLLHRTSLVPFSIEYQVWSKCEIHISNLYWAVQYPHLCSSFCWGEKILEVMTSFYYTYSLILYLNYAKIVFFCLS